VCPAAFCNNNSFCNTDKIARDVQLYTITYKYPIKYPHTEFDGCSNQLGVRITVFHLVTVAVSYSTRNAYYISCSHAEYDSRIDEVNDTSCDCNTDRFGLRNFNSDSCIDTNRFSLRKWIDIELRFSVTLRVVFGVAHDVTY